VRHNRRRWRDQYRAAFRGMKLGMRGHSRFAAHLFAAATAVAACVALDCRPVEWCLVLVCIGMVLATELIHSAIAKLVEGLDAGSRRTAAPDVAAGAVLMAGLFAALVGGIVFVNRLGELMRWWG
jgi:diacylglycerol kinase